MTLTLYEAVANKLNVPEALVRFIWRDYWLNVQRFMSSPVEPEILIKHFGKLQLSTKAIDKRRNSHKNLIQSEYRQSLRKLSLKLTHNKKYDDNELSS